MTSSTKIRASVGAHHLATVCSMAAVALVFVSSLPAYAADDVNLIAVDSALGGSGGFDVLGSANDITTVTMGDTIYVLVASFYDGGIQVAALSPDGMLKAVDSATDSIDLLSHSILTIMSLFGVGSSTAFDAGGFDELDGASDITTVTMGDTVYVLVASLEDSGIQVAALSYDGMLSAVDSATDGIGGFDALYGASGITTVIIDDAVYVLVASRGDDSIQVATLSPEGMLSAVDSAADGIDGFDTLEGANAITTIIIDDTAYVLVASAIDSGIQVAALSYDGMLSAVDSAADGIDGFDALHGAYDITTVIIDDTTYVLVASLADGGIQVATLSPEGMLSAVDSATDGIDGFNTLGGAHDITTVIMDDTTYVLVASSMDSGIQVATLSPEGMLKAAGSVTDGIDGFDALYGASGITTVIMDDTTYVLVASAKDSGIQVAFLER